MKMTIDVTHAIVVVLVFIFKNNRYSNGRQAWHGLIQLPRARLAASWLAHQTGFFLFKSVSINSTCISVVGLRREILHSISSWPPGWLADWQNEWDALWHHSSADCLLACFNCSFLLLLFFCPILIAYNLLLIRPNNQRRKTGHFYCSWWSV